MKHNKELNCYRKMLAVLLEMNPKLNLDKFNRVWNECFAKDYRKLKKCPNCPRTRANSHDYCCNRCGTGEHTIHCNKRNQQPKHNKGL